MSERINKLILEVEGKVTGDFKPSVQQLDDLQKATKAATGDTLKLIEAEKKLEQASAQAGASISTETKKQTDFSKAVQSTAKAMKDIGQTSQLKNAFAGASSEMAKVNVELKKFQEAARSAKSVDELTSAVNDLMAALPEDVRADAFKLIEKESAKLEKTLERPTSRLRELKRLINTTDDPVLLKKLTTEAARLQDELGDTNDLIKSLASDTLFTDTLVQGAQTATAAFSAFQGVTTLFAEDNEELAIAAQKAQGAMSALLGIQQLSIELKRSDNILTKIQTLGQRAYTFAVGESTGALKGFRLALAATGVGLLIIALATLVANFDKVSYALGFGVNPETEEYIKLSKKAVEAADAEAKSFENQASALRLASDRKQQFNEDTVQGTIDRANSEIENINREAEALAKQQEARAALLDGESKKLAELEKQRGDIQKRASASRGRSSIVDSLFGVSKEDVETQKANVATITGELESGIVKLQELENRRLAELKKKTDALKDNFKKQNDDRLKSLAEEERHALALAAIAEKEESDILSIRIDFAQRRRKILQSSAETDKVDIKRLNNEIQELLLEREKALELKEIELFAPGSIKAMQKQVAELTELIESVGDVPIRDKLAAQLKEAEKILEETRKRLFGEEKAKEEEFNTDALDEEERHQLALSSIEGGGEVERLNIQIAFAKERLEILREQGKAETDEAQAIENQLTELQLQSAQARSKQRRQEFAERIQQADQIIQQVARSASQLISIEQSEADRLTDIQQQRVNDAEKIAERGNVAVLRAERERLDELNKQNAKFAQQQIALAQIQLIAQSAVAIAKAAAEGGIAAPFTIAATLIALAAGFAQARAQSQAVAASFYEGGEYGYTGDGPPKQESRKLGKKPYTYHKSEYITPHEVLAIGNNKEWFKKIHLQRLDIEQLLGQRSQNIVVNTGSKEVVEAIKNMPGISISPNARAFFNLTEKRRSLESKRTRLKNWKR